MINTIKYCYQNKKITSIHCCANGSQTLLVGRIERFNDSEILIAHITPHGYYDGFILRYIEDIQRVDYDGDYEKKIEYLYKSRQQNHKALPAFNMDDEIFFSLMDFAKHNDYVISLEFNDNRVSGFVNGYSNNVIYLEVINDYGNENGISIIDIDEILCVAVDSDYEQDLKLLKTGKDRGRFSV